jgi:hypothetical protein
MIPRTSVTRVLQYNNTNKQSINIVGYDLNNDSSYVGIILAPNYETTIGCHSYDCSMNMPTFLEIDHTHQPDISYIMRKSCIAIIYTSMLLH